MPRAVNPTDADALVRSGKFLEIFPSDGIALDRLQNILRQFEILELLRRGCSGIAVEMMIDARHPIARHLVRGNEPPHALLIHRRQRALLVARAKALREFFGVNRFEDAVNPSKAQRFFDRVVVRNARLAARFSVID